MSKSKKRIIPPSSQGGGNNNNHEDDHETDGPSGDDREERVDDETEKIQFLFSLLERVSQKISLKPSYSLFLLLG
jgi:hypothetical protein